MGRNLLPKRYHKDRISLTVRKEVLRRIDEVRGIDGKSRSEFIESFLESILFTDKSYASYRMSQAKLEFAYWQFEFEKAEERVKKEVKLTLGDFEK